MNKFKTYFILTLCILLLTNCTDKNNRQPQTVSIEEKLKKPLMKANQNLVNQDNDRIKSYAERRNWNMQETVTGLWYEVYSKGNGALAKKGMIATINYTVSLLTGEVCYTSDSLGAKTFLIGKGGVETGLEEGILLLHQGDKARFIMPPHLAHGLVGDDNKIPMRSTIIYDVELLNLQ